MRCDAKGGRLDAAGSAIAARPVQSPDGLGNPMSSSRSGMSRVIDAAKDDAEHTPKKERWDGGVVGGGVDQE